MNCTLIRYAVSRCKNKKSEVSKFIEKRKNGLKLIIKLWRANYGNGLIIGTVINQLTNLKQI